jgi:hypothetical protein
LDRYQEAEAESSEIISNSSLFTLESLDNVFLNGSKEAIWQLQAVGIAEEQTANTQEGLVFNLGPLTSNNYLVSLNSNFVDSFDSRDLRKKKWIGSLLLGSSTVYYPLKYKIGAEMVSPSESSVVFRLAEQYLIRGEARIQQGKISDGITDLNILRDRATDKSVSILNRLQQLPLNLTRNDALRVIENERKYELFTEWGHRWMDLKRLRRIDEIMLDSKTSYQVTDKLFPIPQPDISANPNLIGHQNPGYTN